MRFGRGTLGGRGMMNKFTPRQQAALATVAALVVTKMLFLLAGMVL